MPVWEDETYRLQQEVREAIHSAGGSIVGFDLEAIARFLYAAQCNSIDIYRMYPDGKAGKIRVCYNSELKTLEN